MASGGVSPPLKFSESKLRVMKIPELKDWLRRLGLKTSGNKQELIHRLLEYSDSIQAEITKLELEITRMQDDFARLQPDNPQRHVIKTSTPVSTTPVSNSKRIVSRQSATKANAVKHTTTRNPTPMNDSVVARAAQDVRPKLPVTQTRYSRHAANSPEPVVQVSQPQHLSLTRNNLELHESCVNKTEMMEMIRVLSDNMALSRLPTPEPPVFDGNPLQYQEWNQAFTLMVEQTRGLSDSNRLFFLKKYLKGSALEAVDGFLIGNTTDSYGQAKALLDERYGDTYVIAEAYRKKLSEWPIIPKTNSQALRTFSDFLLKCRAAMSDLPELDRLNDTQQNQQMLRLLPDHIVNKWNNKVGEFKVAGKGFPRFTEFVKFVAFEADLASHPTTSLEAIRKLGKTSNKPTSMSHAISTSSNSCYICGALHKVYQCSKFQRMSIGQRQEKAKDLNLCHLCLNKGHRSNDCTLRLKCRECNGKHNTLLHRNTKPKEVTAPVSETSNCGSVHNAGSINHTVISAMIVPVYVSSKSDPTVEHLTYAMLDTQSDSTYITEELHSALTCESIPVSLKLSTMTSKAKQIKCHKLLDVTVRGYNNSTKIPLPGCYTREFIPHNKNHIPDRNIARNYPYLARISECMPPVLKCDVGLLIGYNCPKALMPTCVIQDHTNPVNPYAVETMLGWSIVGCFTSMAPSVVDEVGISHRVMTQEVPLELRVNETNRVTLTHRTTVKELTVDAREVVRLLEGDFSTPIETEPLSQNDQRFLDILSKNIYQDSTGHYVMPLPFKEDKPILPSNREQALARFRMLQKRLSKNGELKQLYGKFMEDLVSAGEAELVPEEEIESNEVWYLPHHGVINPNKPGKVRVVFDGSCDYKGHVLNNYLLQGPDLNNSLVGVLTRFRKEYVTVSCDVSKMFYRFKVSPNCRNYLRFLWTHPEDDQRVVDYRMTVHVFGATSSPGCAKFGLLKIASDYGQSYPEAMNFIKRNFYVDDGLSSCTNTAEAIKLLSEARAICSEGNLKLHKLLSNEPTVLQAFPESEWATESGGIPDFSQAVTPMERMLGLQWCLTTDQFSFQPKPKESATTRRTMLSTLASIFDPLGFIAPVTLLGRQIWQLCCSDLDWDEQLPEAILIKWKKWLADVSLLSSINIHRCLKPKPFGQTVSAELHAFADASERGYGACCYLKLCDQEGQIHCSLLFGKSRVPPLKKKFTIPRLELQAALLAARIGIQMQNELDLSCELFLYTDSLIVLGYIFNCSKRFHTFVANRVSQIRELTNTKQWRHVPGSENPADHASRGLEPTKLAASNWITGPSFLWKLDAPMPLPKTEVLDTDPEVRLNCAVKIQVVEPPLLLKWVAHWTNWTMILRFTSLIYKTVKLRWRSSELSEVQMQQQAEIWLLSVLQRWYYPEEYNCLTSGKLVMKSSPLWRLDAFIDDSGLVRVGGRIKHSSHSPQIKHPIIIPGKHQVSLCLIRHYHNLVAHQGRGFTMATIRSAGYWIVGGSSTISSVIHFCVLCRKMRRPTESQKMANLPSDRTDPAPPFSYIGCDCFGPFMVKDGRKTVKRYGLIFTCMASRAVHIEILDTMSTDGFINSLRCFIALRGNVRQLRCDRGTNFVGAARELQRSFEDIINNDVKQFLSTHKCEFLFNPPGASHMGGAWERLIRTVRNVLHGILLQSQSRLDIASARTVMYEAMTIVNSRPIAMQDDTGLEPLTPNHLIMMKGGVVLPPPGSFEETDLYGRKRWRQVQYLVELFWTRWRSQYLTTLQLRGKWQKPKRNVSVGDVVLLKEGSLRSEWRLGRVVEAIPSRDSLVRRVKLKVASSTSNLERPVTKLVVLIEAA